MSEAVESNLDQQGAVSRIQRLRIGIQKMLRIFYLPLCISHAIISIFLIFAVPVAMMDLHASPLIAITLSIYLGYSYSKFSLKYFSGFCGVSGELSRIFRLLSWVLVFFVMLTLSASFIIPGIGNYVRDRFDGAMNNVNDLRFLNMPAIPMTAAVPGQAVGLVHSIEIGDGAAYRRALSEAIQRSTEQDGAGRPVVHIRTQSTGGNMTAAHVMVQAMKDLRPMALFVMEIGEGQECASACTLVFLAGERRVMHPNGRIMFHEADDYMVRETEEFSIGQAMHILIRPMARLVEYYLKSMQNSVLALNPDVGAYLMARNDVFANKWYQDRCALTLSGWQMQSNIPGSIEFPPIAPQQPTSPVLNSLCPRN